jgi:hypothetical protein
MVAQGQTSCNACPSGTMTSGSGNGADEAGDCGRILHVGDYLIYLRADKKTTPALNVKIDDNVYYGNMHEVTNDVSGHLYLKYNDQTYVVCDETGTSCIGI